MRSATQKADDCAEDGLSRSILFGSLLLSIILGSIFHSFGFIDIEISRAFKWEAEFVGSQLPPVEAIRNGFRALFVASLVISLFGAAASRGGEWFWISQKGWVYVIACLIIGPGLIANVVFKQHWGRPRPHQTIEFGGTKIFQPAWQPSTECHRHCSFVSGEAAATYSTFFALALVVPHFRLPLLAIGTVAGLASGLVRISQGGHYLSDVIFAGLIVAMSCAALHMLIMRCGQRRSTVGA